MKRIFVITLALLIGIEFFSLPVFADYDYLQIPYYSYSIFDFFLNSGFSDSRLVAFDNVNGYISTDTSGVSGKTWEKNRTHTYTIFGNKVLPAGNEYVTNDGGFRLDGKLSSNVHLDSEARLNVAMPTLYGKFQANKQQLWLEKGETYLFCFWSKVDYSVILSNMQFSNGTKFENGGHDFTNKLVRYVFKLSYKGDSGFYYLNFPSEVEYLVPIYFGTARAAPSDALQSMGLSSKEEQAINRLTDAMVNGTDNSNQANQGLNNQTSKLDGTTGKLEESEKQFSESMNNDLNKISTKPGLITNSKFINSAKFVSGVFTKLVINTPFEHVLTFCLTLGISLVMFGKLRNR